jgi:multicomponent Na+:H+ antiporter subunit E
MGKVIYASSITLTPGTVTVNLEGDTLTVHALTLEAATQLQRGEMGQRVCRLEVED